MGKRDADKERLWREAVAPTAGQLNYTFENNRPTSFDDAAGNRTTLVYDTENTAGLQPLLATVQPDGTRNTLSYDAAGRVETSTNARGFVSTLVWDSLGNRTAAVDPGMPLFSVPDVMKGLVRKQVTVLALTV
jgi:YD repeat-containing protein